MMATWEYLRIGLLMDLTGIRFVAFKKITSLFIVIAENGNAKL
jgi:hypothetical protein